MNWNRTERERSNTATRPAVRSPPTAARFDPVITYRTGSDIDIDAVIDVYLDSSIGGSLPLNDRGAIERMFAAANLVVSAWDDDHLIGVARSLTDFTFCTYLSELAVRKSHQRFGVGKALIRKTQKEGKTATIFLFASNSAESYYPHVGFTAGSGWSIPRVRS